MCSPPASMALMCPALSGCCRQWRCCCSVRQLRGHPVPSTGAGLLPSRAQRQGCGQAGGTQSTTKSSHISHTHGTAWPVPPGAGVPSSFPPRMARDALGSDCGYAASLFNHLPKNKETAGELWHRGMTRDRHHSLGTSRAVTASSAADPSHCTGSYVPSWRAGQHPGGSLKETRTVTVLSVWQKSPPPPPPRPSTPLFHVFFRERGQSLARQGAPTASGAVVEKECGSGARPAEDRALARWRRQVPSGEPACGLCVHT